MSLGLIHRRPVHPWAALREAERAFDRMSRRTSPARRMAGAAPGWSPRLEAVETEEGFEVTAEIPGVAREDLEVSVHEGVLTLKGVRRFGDAREAEEAKADEVEDAAEAHVVDENVVRFERRIRFNADVDEEAIAARYANGVLEVRIPKATPPEPEVRTIPVEVA